MAPGGVATGPVAATSSDEYHQTQHEQDESDDRRHLHPAWRAGRIPVLLCHVCLFVGADGDGSLSDRLFHSLQDVSSESFRILR